MDWIEKFTLDWKLLIALKYNPKFKASPDNYDVITNYESPSGYGNEYGVLIRGYITIPQDGDYVFYLASDDKGELYLSTDSSEENKQLIASVSKWTSEREFDKYESQVSVVISLAAGQVLYTEALLKENKGNDHLSVSWSINGGEKVISGEHLSLILQKCKYSDQH